MDRVRIRLAGQRQLVGWDDRGHGIVMDTPAESTGEGTGVRPVELLLFALGGCTAIDVIAVLEKKRQDVRGIELFVVGEPRMDENPHFYERIEIEYVVTGVGVDPAAVARAIQLSDEKYCSVKGALGPQVEVVTSYRVIEFEPQIGPRR